jgi:hypothetical protein
MGLEVWQRTFRVVRPDYPFWRRVKLPRANRFAPVQRSQQRAFDEPTEFARFNRRESPIAIPL